MNPVQGKQVTSSSVSRLFLGFFSGITAAVLLQPLDVIKTRLQSTVIVHSTSLEKRNVLTISQEIYAKDGMGGFWRGTSPSVVRSCLGPGLYFFFLEQFQALEGKKGSDDLLKAGLSRAIAGTLMNPLTVLKTRFEFNLGSKQMNLIDSLLALKRQEGLRGIFAGLNATLLRDIPQAAIYLYAYKGMKQSLKIDNSVLLSGISAFGAGVVSTVATLPIDLIKTTLQLPPTKTKSTNGSSMREIVVALWQNGGFRGFFSGISTRIVRKPIQMAITWTMYDSLR